MVAVKWHAERVLRPQAEVAAVDWPLVDHMRRIAMACRVKPRADLFEACALLKISSAGSLDAYSEALIRSLPEAMGQRPRFLAPGVQELTFDERWLMQLGQAAEQGDIDSLTFLLTSRLRAEDRRLVRFLIGQIVVNFRQT